MKYPHSNMPSGRISGTLIYPLAIVALLSGLDRPAYSQPAPAPTQEKSIVLGMSTALSGPAARLGLNMQTGILAAIRELNSAGGIHGRNVRLVALDDGYEPSRTAPNMHTLIDKEKAVAIIGNVGTPTAVASIPIANENRVPFFGAYTGAGILRKSPPDRYVINFRASYAEETAAMVSALVEEAGIRPEEIAFFTQRDAYGDAGFIGGLEAMRRYGLTDSRQVIHTRYERNTVAVENALADILFHEPLPRAIIMVGAYAPCAEFIALARTSGLDALFLNVSFVGAAPLANALGNKGEGTVVTQVVPHFDAELPIVQEYRNALKTLGENLEPTFGSVEGYIAARILFRALKTITDMPTRESIVDALEGLGTFDIGLNVPLHFSPEDHQACHLVWPTIIRDGRVVPFNWVELGTLIKKAAS